MDRAPLILAADLGGTKALLQLAQVRDGELVAVKEGLLPAAEFESVDALLEAFLAGAPVMPERACLAVAGPVEDGRAALTNLPWVVEARRVAGRFGLADVQLINDFQAVGHGLAALGPDDLLTLQPGRAREGAPRVVLGAGTGLGVAIALSGPQGEMVLASEGGHMDFAPSAEEDVELLRFLQRRHGRHVSWERVVSGAGLAAIYEHVSGEAVAPATVTERAEAGDAAAAEALLRFLRAYGTFAANLALAVLARGGVYLAGGIAPRILPWMRRPALLEAFHDMGRYRAMLQSVPLHVVTTPRVGLLGAARVAAAA